MRFNLILFLDSQTVENIVKEPLKSPQDKKIIIQKVEKVKLEVITNLSSVGFQVCLLQSTNKIQPKIKQTMILHKA
jgi:hypothetical protein